MIAQNKLYTPTFLILCLSYAFFGGSFNMIIPELPSYLEDLGGKEFKGLIIALFTLTAGLSRPFSGKLTDHIGRKPIIIFGAIVCIVCSLIYPILTGVSGFLLLRLIHGFSTGFNPTAITAYVADIVPDHRRGEAMGIIGVSINLGSSITPPIGSFIATQYSLDIMFMASSLCALIALLLVIRLPETVENKVSFSANILKLKKDELISKSGLKPAIVCGLCYMGFGALITITPDQCEYFGMTNKGLFFSSFTFCAILSRLFAGTLSDRYGRIIVIRIAVVILSISYILFGLSSNPFQLIAFSGLVGFALGIAIPAVMAWTVDRGDEENRGRDIATFFIGLEFAIGFGAILGAEIYDNYALNFSKVFICIGVITIFAMMFTGRDKAEQIEEM